MAATRNDLVALARAIVDEDKQGHAEIVAKAIQSIHLHRPNPEELLMFLAQRVSFWAQKTETTINASDLRFVRDECQLALFLYDVAADAWAKQRPPTT